MALFVFIWAFKGIFESYWYELNHIKRKFVYKLVYTFHQIQE